MEISMSDETQAINRVRARVRKQMEACVALDYGAQAELFPCPGKKGRSQMKYKRFASAGEAIRFAVEDLSPFVLRGACLEVDEARFGHHEIYYLYESAAYPLRRCTAPDAPRIEARE
jgi:hypothetical protein